MTDSLVALLFAVGIATWVFGKLMKTTNRTGSSTAGALITGIVGFIVIFTLLKYVLHY